MLYSEGIKNHWLQRIQNEGSHFDPDCGNRHYGYKAAPFIWLLDVHDDYLS